MYLLAAKILGPIALLLGLWFWHTNAVSTAYKTGKAEVMAEWKKSDDIAVAVGKAKTELSARDAIRNTEKLNAKLADLAQRNAVIAADNRSVRNDLAAIAAAPTRDPTPGPACRSYEPEYRGCAGLLAAGVELAGEGPRLAGDIAAKLSAMQEYATLVQSVK